MKKRKGLKIFLSILAVLFVLVNVAGFYAGNLLYDLALNPHSDKTEVLEAEHNDVDYDGMMEDYDAGREWFAAIEYGSQYITSFDGLQLHAYTVENAEPSGSWVVLCHGYGSNGYTMVGAARYFYEWGYNILMPDARGCGHSGGDYIGMGWHDRLDVVAWTERLNALYAPGNIVLYGVSMGGATVMMASGEALPENVRAVVEDCGYSSVNDEFDYQFKNLYGFPSFPLLNYASAVTRIRAGFWLGQGSAVKQVAKTSLPILFIHGSKDTFVPYGMLDVVYEAAGGEKQKLVIEGAGHGAAAFTDPELYWSTVQAFLEKYVG